MCNSPDIPDPVPPPAPPPPPTNMAKKLKTKSVGTSGKSGGGRGITSLTIRRPSTKVTSSGTGARVSY